MTLTMCLQPGLVQVIFWTLWMIYVYAKSEKTLDQELVKEENGMKECVLRYEKAMLQQHRFGRNIARRVVSEEELYAAFPEWLMQMALLMQHGNVRFQSQNQIARKILVRNKCITAF